MSEQTPEPTGPTPARSVKQQDGIPWRLVALGALAVYAILLVILNAERVEVSFVFFSKDASLVVVLLLTLAIGFLGGFLFDTWRERRKGAKARPPS